MVLGSLACSPHPASRFPLLAERHRQQVLRRAGASAATTDHVAARALVPAAGCEGFGSPVVPLAAVRMMVLSWHRTRAGRACGYVRVVGGHLNPATAVTHWTAGVFAGDLSLPLQTSGGRFGSLGAQPPAWVRTALDLDQQLYQYAASPPRLAGFPVLPPTLVAFPRRWRFVPEATPMVLARAYNDKIPWPEAWQRLMTERAVPAHLAPPGLQLVDTRLCLRVDRRCHGPGRGGAAAVYVDLREFLAPARPPAPVVGTAKPPGFRCRPQVWRPPAGAPADAFVFKDLSLQADLWHTRVGWMQQLGLMPGSPPSATRATHGPGLARSA